MPGFIVEIQGRKYQVEAPSLEILNHASERFADWLQNGQTARAPQMEPQAGNTGIATPSRAQAAANAQQGAGFGVPNPAPPTTPEYEMGEFGRMLSEEIRQGRPLTEKVSDWARDVGNGLTMGGFNEAVAGVDALTGRSGMNFQQRLDYENQQGALHQSENPVSSRLVELLGGVATPAAMMKGGASFLSRAQPTMGSIIPRAAAEGAAYGAAGGLLGEGTVQERIRDAGGGAAAGGALGAVGGGVVGTMANRSMLARAPTRDFIDAETSRLYDDADRIGLQYETVSFDRAVQDIKRVGEQEALNATSHPLTNAAMRQLEALPAAPTMRQVETVRKLFSQAARSTAPDGGGDRYLGPLLRSQLDNYIANLTPADVMAGDPQAALRLITEARGRARQGFKMDILQDAYSRAHVGAPVRSGASGIQNALAGEFRRITNNPAEFNMFTAAEQAAIRSVADGGPVENGLRILGLLSPTHPVTAGIGGVAAFQGGGPGAAVGALAGGYGAGRLSAAMTNQNYRLAEALTRGGGAPNAALIPLLQSGLGGVSAPSSQQPSMQALLDILMPPPQLTQAPRY